MFFCYFYRNILTRATGAKISFICIYVCVCVCVGVMNEINFNVFIEIILSTIFNSF